MKCFSILFKSKDACRKLSLEDGPCAPNLKKKEEKLNQKSIINSAFGEKKMEKSIDEINNKKTRINSMFAETKMEQTNEKNNNIVDNIISTNIATSSNRINLRDNKNNDIVCNTIPNNIVISGNQINLINNKNNNIINDTISTITMSDNQNNGNIMDENNICLSEKNEHNAENHNRIKSNNNNIYNNKICYFYEENDVIPFLNLNVIYMGETGEVVFVNGVEKMIYKFGKSYRSIDRDFREHKKTFTNFKMILIIHCDNNDIVEDYLKIELKAKEMLYELPKKIKKNEADVDDNKKQICLDSHVDYDSTILNQKQVSSLKQSSFSETFLLTEKFDLIYVINLMKKLVNEYPLKSIRERDEKIKELENSNKLKEKDIELRIKQEETKQKQEVTRQMQLELEKMKLELEMMKIKNIKKK